MERFEGDLGDARVVPPSVVLGVDGHPLAPDRGQLCDVRATIQLDLPANEELILLVPVIRGRGIVRKTPVTISFARDGSIDLLSSAMPLARIETSDEEDNSEQTDGTDSSNDTDDDWVSMEEDSADSNSGDDADEANMQTDDEDEPGNTTEDEDEPGIGNEDEDDDPDHQVFDNEFVLIDDDDEDKEE